MQRVLTKGCFATPGALEALARAGEDVQTYLRRHLSGDWGEVCDEDKELNDEAVGMEERIMSAYVLPTGLRIWVCTEPDRSATTVLLPEEY